MVGTSHGLSVPGRACHYAMKIAFQFSCTGPVPLRCLFEIYALWNRPRIMRKVFRRRRTDSRRGGWPGKPDAGLRDWLRLFQLQSGIGAFTLSNLLLCERSLSLGA